MVVKTNTKMTNNMEYRSWKFVFFQFKKSCFILIFVSWRGELININKSSKPPKTTSTNLSILWKINNRWKFANAQLMKNSFKIINFHFIFCSCWEKEKNSVEDSNKKKKNPLKILLKIEFHLHVKMTYLSTLFL